MFSFNPPLGLPHLPHACLNLNKRFTALGQVPDPEQRRREGPRLRRILSAGLGGLLRRVSVVLRRLYRTEGHRVVPQASRGAHQQRQGHRVSYWDTE